jgi:hypothetical protein
MRRIIYSACIGTLALALTAWGQQVDDRKPERARPQQRTANVHAARPANTGAMQGVHRNASTVPNRQRSYMAPRSNSNAAMSQNRMAGIRERNLARNEALRERNLARNQEFRARRDAAFDRDRNLAVERTRNINRNRNADEFRARNNMAVNGERNVAVDRTRNVDVTRFRNTNEFRERNGVAVNRERNFAVDRTQNAAFYRGRNVRVTNNWRGDAFRGQRYAAFRTYQRQWHDRGWWRSHYDRIVFVNGGWYYWNAGYWFPAWGYAPYVSYVYDGPIYAYNGWTPERVTVDVQEQLARAGYYDGPIDGVLGPMTREAIAAFQADNGLAVTSAIDEPTLVTLGIA